MAVAAGTAALGAAAIGGVSSILSGIIGSEAANSAASAEEKMALASLKLQQDQYDTTRADNERYYQQARTDSMPWLEAGRTALSQYQGELGLSDEARNGSFRSAFTSTPGYEFAVKEGEKGVVGNMRALGLGGSGAALKALTRFREGLASQEYGNYLNRTAAMAGVGQTAANNNASLGANYAGLGTTSGANYAANAGQTMQDIGNARSSGYAGSANAWTSALGGVSNNATGYLGWASKNRFAA